MSFKKLASLAALSTLFSTSIFAATSAIPAHMNGTWIYDATYKGQQQLPPQAGLFSSEINRYNQSTTANHQLNELFTYGGDMEMFCSDTTGCRSKDLNFYYYPEPNSNSKTPIQIGDSGFRSTLTYKKSTTTPHTIISPVVDGRTDIGYLKKLNTLSPTLAAEYADKVSMAVCADDRIDGIQFDIEPFDLSQPGQQAFYREIAKDFAGHYNSNQQDNLHCVDSAHPNGRFFSVFTFSDQVTATLASIFNQYQNGYVVDSLYDLSNQPGGTVSTPAQYQLALNTELKQLKSHTNQYHVKYQVAIPAAASAHEFEVIDGKPTGYKQLTYTTMALDAVKANGLRNDPNFIGVDVWAWGQKMLWRGMSFEPSQPNSQTLQYLKQNL